MRDWHDNPRSEDVFDEQAAKLPNGPLGPLERPEAKLVEGFSPKELELIRALKIKKIGAMKFLALWEDLEIVEHQSLRV